MLPLFFSENAACPLFENGMSVYDKAGHISGPDKRTKKNQQSWGFMSWIILNIR
jgi:hypothetical protein